MDSIVNIAGYKFVQLDDLNDRRRQMKDLCARLDLKGTILLSREGINLFLAGIPSSVHTFLDELRAHPEFSDFQIKESLSDRQPFNRMLVRLKKEIIAFGIQDIQPLIKTSKRVSPETLKQWLDEGKPITLLDTRNNYEVGVGTFKGAIPANIDDFRHFPEAVNKLPEDLKHRTIVTFCTGGIRCEKAAPFMEQAGFKDVYQLDGGILKYFEDCGGAHYKGECFVFDQRVALDPTLKETETAQCYACLSPLQPEELQSPLYVPGQSCPHCHRPPEVRMSELLQTRHAKLQASTHPLPGSLPYVNHRPLHVAERFDGWPLINVLCAIKTFHQKEDWLKVCAEGRLLFNDQPLQPNDIVRAGYRLIHVVPGTKEPDVRTNIRFVYEDDALVVLDKPAPLPVHPCGRFNRNTLQYILNKVFHPLQLRPAHRLDANTSGIMVCAKTRKIARMLQPQFEKGTITKRYLVRVLGTPKETIFTCTTPISTTPGPMGIRLIDPNGQPAETRFRTLSPFKDGTTLLEAEPITGRTNQIRLHLWSLGLPVQGDPVYLPEHKLGEKQTLDLNDPPLCLQSASIRLVHPISGHSLEFQAEPPEWSV